MLVSVLFGSVSMAAGTVAKIGSTKYTSLEDAVKKVKNGETIVLQKNVSYTSVLSVSRSGKSFTLDLNKKTITFKKGSCLKLKKGTMTIKNGTIVQTSQTGYVIKVSEGATLKVAGGTYKGMISNSGTMTVSKGTFASINKTAGASDAELITNYGTLTISGGTFKGKYNTILLNYGTLSVTGGTFTTTDLALSNYDYDFSTNTATDAIATIQDASFECGILFINVGVLTIKNVTANVTESLGMCYHSNSPTSTSPNVKIQSGKFTSSGTDNSLLSAVEGGTGGTITISGGTFKSATTSSLFYASGSGTIKVTGGTFTLTGSGSLFNCTYADGVRIKVTGGTFTAKKGYRYANSASKANTSLKGATVTTKKSIKQK